MCDLVFDPTTQREYLTESAGLNHLAILPPAAIVTTERDLNTDRQTYGLFVWRQDVGPRIRNHNIA
jgi:hypothetical protein